MFCWGLKISVTMSPHLQSHFQRRSNHVTLPKSVPDSCLLWMHFFLMDHVWTFSAKDLTIMFEDEFIQIKMRLIGDHHLFRQIDIHFSLLHHLLKELLALYMGCWFELLTDWNVVRENKSCFEWYWIVVRGFLVALSLTARVFSRSHNFIMYQN